MRNNKLYLIAVLLWANISAFGQIGMASYYSDEFHGALTASGERYNKTAMTAGHKELPFGSYARVTRLDNNKSVVVRINDRGPFYEGMVVDLSAAAARKLNIQQEGKVEVRVDVVEKPSSADKAEASVAPPKATPPPQPKPKEVNKKPEPKVEKKPTPPPAPKKKPTPKPQPKPIPKADPKPERFVPKSVPSNYDVVTNKNYKTYDLYKIDLYRPKKRGYGVQVASLSSYENAIKHVADLQGKWFENILLSIEPGLNGQDKYKIILGPFDSRDSANNYKNSVKKRYKISGFVVDLSELRYK